MKPVGAKNDVVCVVQARMGSSRLPGKVLQPLGGHPLLGFLLNRLLGLAPIPVVVATSDLDRDDPIAALATAHGAPVVRGSEHDVLARFVAVLEQFPASTVVRITADCPLTDPQLVRAVLALHDETGADYTSNVLPRSFPKGLDVEVVTAAALRAAHHEACDPREREHVTPFVYRRSERFRLANLASHRPLGGLRWTVDTADDLAALRAMVDATGDPRASWETFLSTPPQRAGDAPRELHLRPATLADSDRLLAWRNDPDAVRFSVSGAPVEPAVHHAWLRDRLRRGSTRLLVGEHDGVAVGMVRADAAAGRATVSIAVAPEHRGKGLATELLRLLQVETTADCQIDALDAAIHPDNRASIAAFERAGFIRTGAEGRFDRFEWLTAVAPTPIGTR
jgi:spore coat polysaccharide biosynthesis protein SpsF